MLAGKKMLTVITVGPAFEPEERELSNKAGLQKPARDLPPLRVCRRGGPISRQGVRKNENIAPGKSNHSESEPSAR